MLAVLRNAWDRQREVDGHGPRLLALAVLQLAIRDAGQLSADKEARRIAGLKAEGESSSGQLRRDALAFFDSQMLDFWCGLLGLDSDFVRRCLPLLVERQRSINAAYERPVWRQPG